jgi:hypothetical protein
VNERDQFIQSQVTPMLMPGEQVTHTAFITKAPGLLWQILLIGGLLLYLMTKAYYAVLTNRRLILIRTKLGMWRPKMLNLGVEQYDVTQMTGCTTSGFANNRSMTFSFRDGSKKTWRIGPWNKFVTGTKAFFEQLPTMIGSPALASGMQPAGALQAAPAYVQPGPGYAPAPAMPPAAGGFVPGTRVLVAWTDGNRYPATVVQAQGDQCLCAMSDGQQQWVPAAQLSPA